MSHGLQIQSRVFPIDDNNIITKDAATLVIAVEDNPAKYPINGGIRPT